MIAPTGERPPASTGRWSAWHPWPGRTFGESGAVLLAAAAVLGAWCSWPVPVAVAALAALAALAARRPWAVALSAFLVASASGAMALAGAAPAERAPFSGAVTLTADPVAERGGVRAEVRDGAGRRLDLHALAAAATVVRPRLAGEVLHVEGTVLPRPPDDEWLLRRHVVGTVRGSAARVDSDGGPVARAANGFRRTLARGAQTLPADEQALFTGFVFGDDREERPEVIADFRAAGLSHLLAVSGENVAFVLVAVRPLLRRLALRPRLVVAIGVLLFFAFATRLEPSVLRATAMAMIAVVASTVGRPVSALRALSLAVAALVVLDPFLVGVAGFQLSVAASAGIIVLARPLAARLPGPRALAELAGVTLAAQVGVAPVLLATFGSVPLVSLPANLVAVPAAGPVMVWGLTAGVVAGVAGGPVAGLVHVPTHLLLSWVERVARLAASAPVGDLDGGQALAVAVAGASLLVATARPSDDRRGRRLRRVVRLVGGVVAVGILVLVVVAHGPPAAGEVRLGPGAVLHTDGRGGSVLVVDGSAATGQVLAGLRGSGVRALDALVVRSSARGAVDLATTVLDRVPATLVLVPPGGGTVGEGVAPEPGDVYVVGGLEVQVVSVRPLLQVRVDDATAGEPGARGRGVGSARGPPRRLAARPSGRHHPRAGAALLRHHHPRGGDGHPEPHPGLVLRQGLVLGLRRVPGQGRGVGGAGRRLPGRGWGQGRTG